MTGPARATGPAGDPLVSVSITTYNHAPYIARAVEGVLMQETTFPVELVVGDDCSTDGTREILHELQRRAPDRLRLVLPERNLGRGGVPMFARTMEHVRGRYVAMLDGDDYWTAPDKLARQVAHLEANPECSMCFHDALEVWEDGSRPPQRMVQPAPAGPLRVDAILERCVVPSPSPMFRREAICPLPQWFVDLPIGDVPLYVLAAEHGRIDYLDEVMAVWRMHGRGTWSGLDDVGQRLAFIDARERLNRATGARYDAVIRRVVRAAHYRLAETYGRRGDTRAARRHAWHVLREPRAGGASVVRLVREVAVSHVRRALGRTRAERS